jgi:hypothetical protein
LLRRYKEVKKYTKSLQTAGAGSTIITTHHISPTEKDVEIRHGRTNWGQYPAAP